MQSIELQGIAETRKCIVTRSSCKANLPSLPPQLDRISLRRTFRSPCLTLFAGFGIFRQNRTHLTILGAGGNGGVVHVCESRAGSGTVVGLTCLSLRCLSSYLFFRQFQKPASCGRGSPRKCAGARAILRHSSSHNRSRDTDSAKEN